MGRSLAGGALLVEDLGQQRLPARMLAAVLQRENIPVCLLNYTGGQPIAEVVAAVQRQDPALVVLSQLFAHLLTDHLKLIAALRSVGCDAHITMVGPLASAAHAELLAACPGLDSVLLGEAEGSILALASSLRKGSAWRLVPGLAFRQEGATVTTAPSSPVALDALPWPAYPSGLPEWAGTPFATAEASRGCWHACTFCLPCSVYRSRGVGYRLRSVPGLVAELEGRFRAGARLVLFDDEQFLPPAPLHARRVADLRRQLQHRGVRIGFTIKCRADDVEPRLFADLREAGLLRVYVGLESNCQATLEWMGKGTSPRTNANALHVLDNLGIVADYRCLFFHPWATLDSIRAEMRALSALVDVTTTCLSFREVEVYPGTPLAQRLADEGRPVPALEPLAYQSAEPAAEVLRRLSRLVFGHCRPYQELCQRVTQAWFALLLSERGLARSAATPRPQVRQAARSANLMALALCDEMMDFAARGEWREPHAVNAMATQWSAALALGSARLLAGLADPGAPVGQTHPGRHDASPSGHREGSLP